MKSTGRMVSSQQKQQSARRALQSSQRARENKDELLDMIMASGEDGSALTNIGKRVDDAVKAVDALKSTITAQNTMVNNN